MRKNAPMSHDAATLIATSPITAVPKSSSKAEWNLPFQELDTLIATLPYGAEAKAVFPDLPDPDRDRYPSSIHPTAPEDATWRKSFKVWGNDLRNVQANPYWPYAYPTMSPGVTLFKGRSESEAYVAYDAPDGTYAIWDKGGNGQPVHCIFCKGTTWQKGTGDRKAFWYCVKPSCNEDHAIR